jgi:thioredoxin reductase (NADPH)
MIELIPPCYEIVIVGSGPAGLTAAIYAARNVAEKEQKPLVIEGHEPQGQLMKTTVVENWPGDISVMGPTLMERMRDHAKHFKTQFSDATVEDIDVGKYPYVLTLDDGSRVCAKAIILAMGATPKRLNCPGEEKHWGMGVSSCATCDGALYSGKKVIIVGGGDTAMEYATVLLRFAKEVTIVHIRDKLAASPTMQEKVLHHPSVTMRYSETVTEVLGDGKKVAGVILTHQKTGEQTRLAVDGVFVAIGLSPNSSFLPKAIKRDKKGYVETIPGSTATTVPGIFAAGDIVDWKYRQAIVSAGTGCAAALEAERWLEDKK